MSFLIINFKIVLFFFVYKIAYLFKHILLFIFITCLFYNCDILNSKHFCLFILITSFIQLNYTIDFSVCLFKKNILYTVFYVFIFHHNIVLYIIIYLIILL